jgi:peptidoglycan hydrolase CwlO-like protein
MKKIYRIYLILLTMTLLLSLMTVSAFAVSDMWTVAQSIIVDVYSKIAGISTVLAGLMSAVAVIGAKLSNNQHKVDQAWDWLKRIWIAWAIINGIGAFIAYIAPLFNGLATLTP